MIRPLSSAKQASPSRPTFGTLPVIWRASQAAAPSPFTMNRENPGRSRIPAASRTARHSSRTAPNHAPSRAHVWVPASEVSSPARAYHSPRSHPLFHAIILILEPRKAARIAGPHVPFGRPLGDPFRQHLARTPRLTDAKGEHASLERVGNPRHRADQRVAVGRIGDRA